MVKQSQNKKDKGIQYLNQDRYAGDSIDEHRIIESENIHIAEKEIGQQNENL